MAAVGDARKRAAENAAEGADVEALAEWIGSRGIAQAVLASDWLAAHTAAAREKALLPIRRYAEAAALTAKVRGQNERPWLDLLILCDREAGR